MHLCARWQQQKDGSDVTTYTWDEYEALDLPPVVAIFTPEPSDEDPEPKASYLLQDDKRALLAETDEHSVELTELTPEEVEELLPT